MYYISELFAVCCLLTACQALYENTKVMPIEGKNFNEMIHKNENAAIVQFYSPNCGYCKRLRSAFAALANTLSGLVDVAAVDCSQTFNQGICSRYEVKGYPSIKLFIFAGKGVHKRAIEYDGNRSKEDMISFVEKHMHSFIFKISPKAVNGKSKWNVTLDKFSSKGLNLPKLIMVKPSDQAPTMLVVRALSIAYHYKVVFGEILSRDQPEMVKKLNLPADRVSIVMIPAYSEEAVVFTGPLKRKPLVSFIDAQLKSLPKSKVIDLNTWDSIESTCLTSPDFNWCVLLLFNSENDQLIADSIELALKAEGLSQGIKFIKGRNFDESGILLKKLRLVEDYPSVLLIAPKEKKYAVMMKEFSRSSFAEFLQDAVNGKARYASFDSNSIFKVEAEPDHKLDL